MAGPSGRGRSPIAAAMAYRRSAVCAGKVTLTAAQKAIDTDWTTALSSLGPG